MATLFETFVLILYVLPFAVGAIDLLRIDNLFARSPCRCKCQFVRCCVASRSDRHPGLYAKGESDQHARDAKRTRCLAKVLNEELRLVGRRDFHTNTCDSGDNSPVGGGAGGGNKTARRQRDEPAARFKHISRSIAQYIGAVDAAVATLHTSPLSLSWQHLIEIENCARALSKLAFSATAPTAPSKSKHRTVSLSFENARGIWKTEVARGICEDEGKGDVRAVPSMSGVVASRNAIIAMLVPGTNMGSVNVGQKAAMGSFRRSPSQNLFRKKLLTTTADSESPGRVEVELTTTSAHDVWADAPESKRGITVSEGGSVVVPKLRIPNQVQRVARVDTPRKMKSTGDGGSGGLLGRGRSRVPAAVAKKAKTEAKKARLDALIGRLAALGLDLKRSDPSAVPAQGGSAISLKSLARYIVDGEENLGWAVQFVKEKRRVVT